MKLRDVVEKMKPSDMMYVWRGMYKFYGGLVRQGTAELQKHMDEEVVGLSPSMYKGLMIELKGGAGR